MIALEAVNFDEKRLKSSEAEKPEVFTDCMNRSDQKMHIIYIFHSITSHLHSLLVLIPIPTFSI